MNNIGKIELEGMEFKAYHGCLEQEKVRGNQFVVDFEGELDLSAAAESDNLRKEVETLKTQNVKMKAELDALKKPRKLEK